jgi:protein-disulfide isomerase
MYRILVFVIAIFFPGYLSAEVITEEQGDANYSELLDRDSTQNEYRPYGLVRVSWFKSSEPETAIISTAGNPSLGNPNAPVTMVMFTDYQCRFAQKFHFRAYKYLKAHYIDTGKLRFVLRDLPLNIHQDAKPAAVAAHCAGEQGKFWEMHDTLIKNKGKLSQDDILGYAKSNDLESVSFKSCLISGRYDKDIDQDIADARNAGINGTPGFVVARTTDNLVLGTILRGNKSFYTFKNEIDRLLLTPVGQIPVKPPATLGRQLPLVKGNNIL